MGLLDSGRPTWKGSAALLAKMAFSTALMVFLFSRVPLRSLESALAHADWSWLGLAGFLLAASYVLGAFQWSRLLNAVGARIPFWKVCSYYFVGLFFNNFLPANIGGDIARVVDASRHGPTRGAVISTVVMDRLIGTLALAGLALITTVPAIDRFHLTLVYGALLLFFALSLITLWAVFHPRLLPALERALARVGLKTLKPVLDELALRIKGFRDRQRLMIGLIAVAAIVQLSRIGVHVLVAKALNIRVPPAYFFLFVPLLAVIISLPISLNGIGVREGAGIVLFGLVGVGRTQAFSLQFTTYLVAVAVSLVGGLVFLVRIPHRAAGARQSRRTT